MEAEETIRLVVQRLIAENPDPEFFISDDPAAEVAPVTSGFLAALARVLEHLCGLCEPRAVTRFDAVRPPQISILAYLQRLQKYFACSGECFVLALVYLDRIVKFHPDFVVSKFNIHRLLVSTVMAAAKFWDDVWYSNQHYAKVGGVQLAELNNLEVELMTLLKWNLTVSPDEYDQYMGSVTTATAPDQCTPEAAVAAPPPAQTPVGRTPAPTCTDDCEMDGATAPTGEGRSTAADSASSSPWSNGTEPCAIAPP